MQSILEALRRIAASVIIAAAGVFAIFSIVSELWFAAAARDCASAGLPGAGMLYFFVVLVPTPIGFVIASVNIYGSAREIRPAHVWIALAVAACCLLSWWVFSRLVPNCN